MHEKAAELAAGCATDEEKEACKTHCRIALATLATFPRLKAFGLPEERLADLVRSSQSVRLLEKDGTCYVERVTPLPQDYDQAALTLYVKGFPRNATVDQITSCLKYGMGADITYVIPRRAGQSFKGSVLAVFRSGEARDAFFKAFGAMEKEDPERVKASHDYWDAQGASLEKDATDALFAHIECMKGFLTVLNYADWRAAESKGKKGDKAATATGAAGDKADAESGTDSEFRFTAGCILKITNVGTAGIDMDTRKPDVSYVPKGEDDKPVTRELIRQLFEPYGAIRFVEYSPGDLNAYVRYDMAALGAAAKACEEKKGLKLGGTEVELAVLAGQDEQDYYAAIRAREKARPAKGRKGQGGKGRGRRGQKK